MAAAVWRQWSVVVIVGQSSDMLTQIAARSRFLCAKSRAGKPVPKANGVVVSMATAAAAVPCVVVTSQHSNARIEKSNRRSRFRGPLMTTDCEDDDDLCEALSADFQLLEMEVLEEEVAGRKSHRKGKKGTRSGVKRLDSLTSSKVIPQNLPSKGGITSDIKKHVRSGGSNAGQINPRAAGIKIKSSSVAKERRVSAGDDRFLDSLGDKFLTRKAWEEQAYQIIRRQKLRDAALAGTTTRSIAETPKGLVKASASDSLTTNTANASPQIVTCLDGGSMEDVESSSLKRLGLEDKCQALVTYLYSLGLRERDFVRILDRHKACLQANLDVVKERVDFLLTVGVKFQHLPKLIVRHPQILEYRVEQAMKPRVRYLKSLGLDESKIGKVITVSPSLLECSLQRSIKPRIAYLVKTVGIKSQDIGKIVMRSPQILTQSIEDALEPRLDFFLNEVKLPREALAKMVTRHPQLLHYSIEDGVRPRVKYLRSLGMSDDDIIKVLTRLTQILSLSIEKCLQPKYNYLVKELNGGVHTVTSFPAYFSLSLDQRIIPRHRYSEALERSPDGPFPMRLLTISDIAFCQWAKSSVEAYDKFRHDLLLSTFAKKFEWKNKVQI